MSWKQDLKDWGSAAWYASGIIVLVSIFSFVVAHSGWSIGRTAAKDHFKEKHGVECTCK